MSKIFRGNSSAPKFFNINLNIDTAKHKELKENIYNRLGLLLKLAKYLDKM